MERTTRMGMSVVDAVKEIQARDSIFVAYSQVTKLPYVTCAEETYNDQAWFFAEEETLKEFGKKKLDDKILLMGMKYEKKDFPRMYGLLYAVGVNSLVWNNGSEEIEVDLDKIVRQPDLSKVEPEKRPLINATLQLSGIYFMQELRHSPAAGRRRFFCGNGLFYKGVPGFAARALTHPFRRLISTFLTKINNFFIF